MLSAAVASCTPLPTAFDALPTAAKLQYSSLHIALDTVLQPYVPPTALMHSGPVDVLMCVCVTRVCKYSLHIPPHFFVTCDSILPVVCRVSPAAEASVSFSCACCLDSVAAPLLRLLWMFAMSGSR